MEFQPLYTNRLHLRKIIQQDAPFILEALSNDELTKYMLIHYYSFEEVQTQMDFYANHYTLGTGCYWLMEKPENQQPVGIIGLNAISTEHSKAELGFWVLPSFWGQGYTTEAAKAVLQFCFLNNQFNRIEATVETENIASISVLRKLGFLQEGVFREYEKNNDKFIDLMMFAMLKKDFINLSYFG